MTNLVWLGGVVLFSVLEMASEQLVSIWFVLGAVFGLFASVLSFPFLWQLTIFAVTSALALLFFRPVIYRRLAGKNTPTNADRAVGKLARVRETTNGERGAAYVDGKEWSARSADGGTLQVGEAVRVLRIEGVKLIVERARQEDAAQAVQGEAAEAAREKARV